MQLTQALPQLGKWETFEASGPSIHVIAGDKEGARGFALEHDSYALSREKLQQLLAQSSPEPSP